MVIYSVAVTATLPARRPVAELGGFKPFSALSDKGRTVLAQGTSCIDCRKGAVILHKGQPVSGAYVVLNGRLRVFTVSPGGIVVIGKGEKVEAR